MAIRSGLEAQTPHTHYDDGASYLTSFSLFLHVLAIIILLWEDCCKDQNEIKILNSLALGL